MGRKPQYMELICKDMRKAESGSSILKWISIIMTIIITAISIKISNFQMCLGVSLLLVFFWIFNAYYVWQRNAVHLMCVDAMKNGENTTLNANDYKKKISFGDVLFKNIDTAPFYAPIIILMLILSICL